MTISVQERGSLQGAAAHDALEPVLRWLVRGSLAWLFLYLVLQGPDGFFARTVDRIDASWVGFSFLNIPLQLLLTVGTVGCAASERPLVRKVGVGIGALNATLILGHVLLSVATA
jgi:hypothetical protein